MTFSRPAAFSGSRPCAKANLPTEALDTPAILKGGDCGDRHHTRPRGEKYETNPISHNPQGINGLQSGFRHGGTVGSVAFRFSPAFAGLFCISGARAPEGPGDWSSGDDRSGHGVGPTGRAAAGLPPY